MKQGLVILFLVAISVLVVMYDFIAYAEEIKPEARAVEIIQATADIIHDELKDIERQRKQEQKEERERKQKEAEAKAHDLDLLARLINAEAGSTACTYDMRLYVGSIVINRVKSSLFPNSIEKVIYQAGQYQCTWNGMINKKPSKESREIAEKLIAEGSAIPDNVLYCAEFVQGSGTYAKIQNLYFCYR